MKDIDIRVLVVGLKQMQIAYRQTCPEMRSWVDAAKEVEAILKTLLAYVEDCENEA